MLPDLIHISPAMSANHLPTGSGCCFATDAAKVSIPGVYNPPWRKFQMVVGIAPYATQLVPMS
jgi:hypothetical protein